MERLLVKGAEQAPFSNRARGMGEGYEDVSNEATLFDFAKCTTFHDILVLLEVMRENDYHFVGSRDYVYCTPSMIAEVNALMSYLDRLKHNGANVSVDTFGYAWNLFTRTLGLREGVINACKTYIEKVFD